MLRASRGLLTVTLASSMVGAQCRPNDRVSFEIGLPGALDAQAQWMEIGVIDGPCPSAIQLAGGIPRSGTLTRIAFARADSNPPLVGDLKKAPYAFAAVARGNDCGIVATGCTIVDLTKAKDVNIQLAATQQPSAACSAAETCVEAQCVPAIANGDTSLGARCSMQLVGAGPLGDPLVLYGSDVVSAPALVATESGFLVAYREYDPNAGSARLTLAAIDSGGGLTIAPPTMLAGQCSGAQETDAVGLAYLAGTGVVVSARPQCGGQQPGGLDALQVDASGKVTGSAFNGSLGLAPTLSNAHAVARAGASSGWVALLDQGAAQVVALSGVNVQGRPSGFGGPPPETLAQVAATDQIIALLTARAATSTVDDGGGPAEAAAPPPALRLLLSASSSPGDAGAPYVLPGTWGAVAAEGGRAFVLSDSPGDGTTFTWTAVDIGAPGPAASDSYAPNGQGHVLGGDVAFHGDRAMVAAEQPGSIAVVVYDHASTTPAILRTLLLSDDPRVPPQMSVRDGRVAIAASDSQVAVTWVTATNLGLNDAVGGYAVYACSQ
jgi:hypothetical protein